MRWYFEPGGLLRSLPQTDWHRWFAWYPVTLTEGKNAGKLVWWKYIERKIKIRSYDDDYFYRDESVGFGNNEILEENKK